ncbi:LysR family transcriptional regulator [Thioalkalivibrio sp.]|uniref:LysR family transcriptional regulator n=1 Tax=Thioalkalivibrio sp. TaxID=2093813 RepID=UPI00356AC95D
MPKVTLEQWRMLKAVVDAGGFAKAAENVHKSASSINHAVQKLQKQLGVPLLEVRGRRTELTPAGEALLRRGEQLLNEACSVEELAEVLGSGIQTELSLAVDQLIAPAVVISVLHEFSGRFPSTRVQLHETVLEGGPSLLQSGEADLLIGPDIPPGFLAEPLGQVRMICVAHPLHPLALRPGLRLSTRDLRHSRQVVVRDSSRGREAEGGWLDSDQRWTVTHMATALRIVRAGFAFAWLPECLVGEYLDGGALVTLRLQAGSSYVVPFSLAFGDPDRSGIATLKLAEMLTTAFAERVPDPASAELPDWWSLARCGPRAIL